MVSFYSQEAQKRSIAPKIARVEDTDERNQIFISTEDKTSPDFVAEGATIPLNDFQKGYRTSFLPKKVAERIEITMETLVKSKDPTEKIMQMLDDQTKSLTAQIYNQAEKRIHDYYNNGFTNLFAVSPDVEPLFSATHTYASGGIFDNLLPAVAPSTAVLDDVEARAGAFLAPNGMPMTLNVNKILCKKGGSASREWKKILWYNNNQYHPTTVGTINIYQGALYEIIESPFITSPTAYFLLSDFEDIAARTKNPIIQIYSQRPTIMEDFTRDPRTGSKYTFVSSMYKDGIADLPVGLFGSAGA